MWPKIFNYSYNNKGKLISRLRVQINFPLHSPSHHSAEHNGVGAAWDVPPSPEGCLPALVWQSSYPGINALIPGLEEEIPLVGSSLVLFKSLLEV